MTTETNAERLRIIKDYFSCKLELLDTVTTEISNSDVEWLIQQAATLQWVKDAILVCNEEDVSPRELARLLDKSNL